MRAWIAISLLAAALAACAPSRSTANTASGDTAPPARSTRTLVAVAARAPNSLAAKAVGTQAGGAAVYLSRRLFNADLSILDGEGVPRPYLAESLPQLNTASWQVFPDGRMETTYHLKPNLAWHNGTPLTSEDFVFAWRVYATPELGVSSTTPVNLIEEVAAPDSRSVVIRWKRPYPNAGALESLGTGASGAPPLPRSLLEGTLEAGSAEAFFSQPFWTRDYVGLGPYRLQSWEPGAFYEAVAFEQHALGAPKIPRIRLLFMSDSNAAMASMIAGEVFLAADDAVRVGQVPVVLAEWGPGRGAAVLHPNQWRNARFQFRPEYVSPRALLDLRVRKALAHTIDKAPINEAVYEGQALLADTMISPQTQVGGAVDAAITKYPFDPRRAEELMNTAGFTKAADGLYTSATEGRFITEIKTNAASDNTAEMSILASGWRQAGFEVRDAVLSAVLSQDNEARATFSGIFSANTNVGVATALDFGTADMARPENRWQGSNRGGFANADYDRLAAAFTTALEPAERTRLLVEITKLVSEELPSISLFFRAQAWVHTSDLRGPKLVAPETNMSWNIQEWEFQ